MVWSFSSIKAELSRRLSLLNNWTTALLNLGVYARILDVISYITEKFQYTLDYDKKNSFLQTAQDLSAVVANAWALSYKVHRQYGANGRVKVSGDPTFSISLSTYIAPSVEIPRWTAITDAQNQVNLYTTADALYPNGIVIGNRQLQAGGTPLNFGSGKIGFTVTAHGFPTGQMVYIRGTQYYDGDYLIDPSSNANTIVIEFPNSYIIETFDGTEKIYTGVVYIPVKEGLPSSFLYIASGAINEKFIVYSNTADNDQVEVSIVDSNNNLLYSVTNTDDIYLINSLAYYYCTIESLPSFEGFTIQFGDGVTSKKLNTGDRVLVKYATTLGAKGNVGQTGIISTFKNSVTDLAGNSANIFLTNDELITGGEGVEDIEHARHFSRDLFYAGFRFHSYNDDVAIIDAHPDVAKSIVWSDEDVNPSAIASTNSIVHISAVANTGEALTLAQQNDIKINYLKLKRSVTDIIKFEPLGVICAQFRTFATLKPVVAVPVVNNIYNALNAKYGILNAPYKQSIYESNAFTVIQNADTNIIHHHTDLWIVDRSEDYPVLNGTVSNYPVSASNPAGIEPDPTKQVYIQNLKVEIWITRKVGGVILAPIRIAYCNPSIPSQLIGDNSYTISGGFVTYASNLVTFVVMDIVNDIVPPGQPGTTFGVQNPSDTDNDGYAIRVTYKTKDGNGAYLNDIRVPNFFNITQVHLEDVSPPYFTFEYQQ
jgi:hypothetical protein